MLSTLKWQDQLLGLENFSYRLDLELYFEHDNFLLKLEIFDIKLLLIACQAELRPTILTALEFLLRYGDSEAWLLFFMGSVKLRPETTLKGAHRDNNWGEYLNLYLTPYYYC